MTNAEQKLLIKNLKTVIKKLHVFTLDDLEVLLEKPQEEIMPILEYFISKNILKPKDNSYIYNPKNVPQAGEDSESIEDNSKSYIHTLPFNPFKPKEIYLRHINEIDGFVDYFFAPPNIKKDINKMLKILKETHGKNETEINEILNKNNVTRGKYTKFKKEISRNGLVNLVKNRTCEPNEIYYFFKQIYLSPKQLSVAEARELAIQKFENLINLKINRKNISSAKLMNSWLHKEFSENQIEKYRNINFSEFDTDHIYCN